jgi:hypothetical protein
MADAFRVDPCRRALLEVFVKSPVRENCTPGSVRGTRSDPRLYLDKAGIEFTPSFYKVPQSVNMYHNRSTFRLAILHSSRGVTDFKTDSVIV